MHEVDQTGHAASVIPPESGVSFVIPVLNERDYLQRAVDTVLEQDIDDQLEVILALGPSTDGTTELARSIAMRDDRIVLIDNPAADIPVGLNLAIRASKYPTIVRVDAHSALQPGYTRRALETLNRVGAANVGGTMRADGKTTFQRAAARAYNSPFGLGGGAHHSGTKEGEADTAYLGVMRRDVLDEVGLFDETIRRGEDWELNLRIRRAGYRVWFDPALSVTYWPRDSWNWLVRQFYATGRWRGELVRRFGNVNSIKYFAPPGLIALILAALVIGGLQLTGVISGLAAILASVVYLPLIAYVLIIAAVAIGTTGGSGLRDRMWTAVVLPSMHLAWGLGFIVGLVQGAGDTVDSSRVTGRYSPLP